MERMNDSLFPDAPMSQQIFNDNKNDLTLEPTTPVDWHQQLRDLVQEVCQHPPNSRDRRKGFNRIVRMIQQSGKRWRSSDPCYEDALQEMWLHFSRNLCEGTTSENPYCAADCAIIARLNAYLKRRLQDYSTRSSQEQKQRVPHQVWQDGKPVDPVDLLEAPADVPPLLEEVRAWVETDATGELQSTHIKGRSDVTCQVLILRRLPPETPWKELAREFGISIATLSGFYEKQCRSRLRKFGQSEGYL